MVTVTAIYGAGQCVAPTDWNTKGIPRPYRLYYVIDGEAYYTLGGERHRLLEGHFYLFTSSLPFNVTQSDENRLNHLYYDFMMTPAVVSTAPLCLSKDEHPLLESLLGVMQSSVLAYREARTEALFDTVRSLLEAFLSLFLSLAPRDEKIPSDVLFALEYIEKHYSEDITVGGIAALVFLDEDYFIRKFKRAIGITPYAYIRNLRLAVARELRAGGESLGGASLSVGYKYPSSYCRAVKRSQKSKK